MAIRLTGAVGFALTDGIFGVGGFGFDADSALGQFQGGGGYIPFAKLSPDHRLLLSMYDDSPRVWDVRTGMLLFTIPGPGKVLPAAFSADDSRLAIADFEHVRVWDARAGKPICQLHLDVTGAGLEDVGISRDGALVYCHTSDGVSIFSGTTGKFIRSGSERFWRKMATL